MLARLKGANSAAALVLPPTTDGYHCWQLAGASCSRDCSPWSRLSLLRRSGDMPPQATRQSSYRLTLGNLSCWSPFLCVRANQFSRRKPSFVTRCAKRLRSGILRPLTVSVGWSVAVAAACGSHGTITPAEAALESGLPITALVSAQNTAAVVVIDPADCTSCNVQLQRWVKARAAGQQNVRLVLVRRPSEFEHRQLVLRGVHADGILKDWRSFEQFREPVVLRWVRGGTPDVRPLREEGALLDTLIALGGPADSTNP